MMIKPIFLKKFRKLDILPLKAIGIFMNGMQ